MTVLQAIVLSIVQGITEFLPISSSGHLILFPKLFGWPDQGLAFDAFVHLGTALAVACYFFSDIKRIIKNFFSKGKSKQVVCAILLSMVPALLGGVFLKDFIAVEGRSFRVVLFSLIVWGLVLILAENYAQKSKKKKDFDEITWKQGLIIGCAQALALIPGTSRSGITLAAGYFLDINRKDAIKFSFLMGLPVIFGAGLLSFLDLVQTSEGTISYLPLAIAFLGAFLSGLLAIHLLEKVIEKRGLYYFGAYRIVLALSLFWIF